MAENLKQSKHSVLMFLTLVAPKDYEKFNFMLENIFHPHCLFIISNWTFIHFRLILPKGLHRGSYMSAHVLLNLLNELGKRDKMRGLSSILFLFRNEFNKFTNTRARMLDSIYHMTNTLKSHFWRKNVIILSLCTQRCYGRQNVSRKSINH